MNDIKLADLNDIQDFFNRVDSASTTENFKIDHPIGVKDFIGWCNEPCDYYPKSSTSDPAYRLGKTICALNELAAAFLITSGRFSTILMTQKRAPNSLIVTSLSPD